MSIVQSQMMMLQVHGRYILYILLTSRVEVHPSALFPPQSDPFVEISKVQEGGGYTIVYRSKHLPKTLDPK